VSPPRAVPARSFAHQHCLDAKLLSLRNDFGRDLSRLSAPDRRRIDAALQRPARVGPARSLSRLPRRAAHRRATAGKTAGRRRLGRGQGWPRGGDPSPRADGESAGTSGIFRGASFALVGGSAGLLIVGACGLRGAQIAADDPPVPRLWRRGRRFGPLSHVPARGR
jgi:hypothetical protein